MLKPRAALPPPTLAKILASALFLLQAYIACANIMTNIPYVAHVDEPAIMDTAANILRTGDYNPHFFNYPSLPIYLTAGAMAAGYLNSASHMESGELSSFRNFSQPFYVNAQMAAAPKLLFAMLGVTAAFFAGLALSRACGNPHLLWATPLALSLSSIYTAQMYYLNPNIPALFFIYACTAYVLCARRDDSYAACAIIPGILVGLAAACKYNNAVLLLTPLAALFLFPHHHRGRKLSVYIAVIVCAFILAMPYSLLDLPNFLKGVAAELYHYAYGHGGAEGPPGWPQLLYFTTAITKDLGFTVMGMALFGLICACAVNWRNALLLSIFPLFLLTLMSAQRVHFLRNLLPIYVWILLCASYGATFLLSQLLHQRKKKTIAAGAVFFACLLGMLPWNNARERYAIIPDSRNLVIPWIMANIPAKSVILIPSELRVNYRKLTASYTVQPYSTHAGPESLVQKIIQTGSGYVILGITSNTPPESVSPIPEDVAQNYHIQTPEAHFGEVKLKSYARMQALESNPELKIYRFTAP